MIIYGWISYCLLILISLYTVGFSWQLLKEEKNKLGSIFVLTIALSLLIIPLLFYR